MLNGSKPVSSEGKILPEEATFPIYESVDEAVESVGEEALLKIVNGAVETAARNDSRRVQTGGSKVSLKDLKALIAKVPEDQMAALSEAVRANDNAAVAEILRNST